MYLKTIVFCTVLLFTNISSAHVNKQQILIKQVTQTEQQILAANTKHKANRQKRKAHRQKVRAHKRKRLEQRRNRAKSTPTRQPRPLDSDEPLLEEEH